MKSSASKRHSAKEIEFNADELIESLRDHAAHLEGRKKITMRMTRIALPERVEAIRPHEIMFIRKQLRVSQPVFAALLNVPVATARSWEQGKRSPSGAALRLLDIARRNPEVLVPGRSSR